MKTYYVTPAMEVVTLVQSNVICASIERLTSNDFDWENPEE